MTARRGERDLDELVARSYDMPRPGPRCWASQLEGEVAAYVRRLEELVASGRRPVWTRVEEILADQFELQVSYDSISRHLLGRCSCRRR